MSNRIKETFKGLPKNPAIPNFKMPLVESRNFFYYQAGFKNGVTHSLESKFLNTHISEFSYIPSDDTEKEVIELRKKVRKMNDNINQAIFKYLGTSKNETIAIKLLLEAVKC